MQYDTEEGKSRTGVRKGETKACGEPSLLRDLSGARREAQ